MAGIRDLLISIHYLINMLREHLAKVIESESLRIVETYEPELLGSVGMIHVNRD